MIPHTIHYCWFGRSPLPESARKCIASWRTYFPGYEIREWNEDNFDVNAIPYTREAYAARKYAFVSDYARFWILYRHGGIYFDTDVEVIRPFDDILRRGPFMGIELRNSPVPQADATDGTNVPAVAPGLGLGVNPGLGLGVNPGLGLYKELLELYDQLHFVHPDGSLNEKTIVIYTTEVLARHGLRNTDGIQQVAGVWIYPQEYFNPLDDLTGRLCITANTRSIHWFMKSWQNHSPLRLWLSRWSHRLFGMRLHNLLRRGTHKAPEKDA